jgi:4-hydroxythreonine-4-phosphate dehydrogenase
VSAAAPIALTCGESAGIGPDLCLAMAQGTRDFPLVCLADRDALAARARLLKTDVRLSEYRAGQPVDHAAGTLSVLHLPLPHPAIAGRLEVRNARQVLALIDRAVDGCCSGEFSAMVTAPAQKSIIIEAGFAFSGHTEYIAARCGAALPVMLLVDGDLRVALATTHLPLRAVPDALSIDGLCATLRIISHDLTALWGIARPRIAVCGLNPHAGERGHLGHEEQDLIEPALERSRAAGLDVHGPFPADTLFVPRYRAGYDALLAMYHDQGLPVLKASGFGTAVNVTLGLPIVRTSVDHGTALDLAGSGRAEAGSLRAAVALAAELAARAPQRS